MVYEGWKNMGKDVVASSPFSERVFDFIPAGGAVLDLGCGNGRISKLISERGYQTYGIDINEEAINSAKSDPDLSGINFSIQDSRKTNFDDNFFDAVIEQSTLACLKPREREEALKEVQRVLKPNGILSIAEFGLNPDKEDKYQIDAVITGEYGTRIIRKEDGSEWFRSHNFEKTELENLISEAGFKIIWEAHPNFVSLKKRSYPGHQYVVKKL